MIFRIAWRNLLEYRSRTLIIGVMVALSVYSMPSLRRLWKVPRHGWPAARHVQSST